MTVPLARVGDIAEQVRGVTFAKPESVTEPAVGHVPVLRAGNIQESGLDFMDLVYVPADRVRDKQRVRRNDIVIAASSGSLDVVGKSARSLTDFEGGFGAFCKVLRPGPDVDPSYFAHYFKTPAYRRKISSLAEGANINNLKNEHLNDLLMPLPALDEQRRIAAILDQADALRSKRREALAQLDDLTQSIFFDMFGDPDLVMKSGNHVAFADVVAELQGGKNLIAADPDLAARNRVLKISAVTGFRFRPSESKPLPDDYSPPAHHFVRSGDLLMSRANTTELVGAVALVGSTPPNLVLPDKLWRFVWREPEAVDPVYVWALLQTPAMRRELSTRSSGTGGSMKNISKAKLNTLQMPWPGVDEQRSFAQRITAVDAIMDRCRSGGLDGLFESLQARAFAGKL